MPHNPRAFPRPFSESDAARLIEYAQEGMTLRDYFAAKAMHAFASIQEGGHPMHNSPIIASWAYTVADAMLAEREKMMCDEKKEGH